MKQDITLRQLQQQVDDWIETTGVRYFSELTNLAQLVEEVGELARIVSRKYGDQSFKDGERAGAGELADELSDILFVLVCLANQTGVDLDEAWRQNMVKKNRRDGQRHLDNPKLANEPTGTPLADL